MKGSPMLGYAVAEQIVVPRSAFRSTGTTQLTITGSRQTNGCWLFVATNVSGRMLTEPSPDSVSEAVKAARDWAIRACQAQELTIKHRRTRSSSGGDTTTINISFDISR